MHQEEKSNSILGRHFKKAASSMSNARRIQEAKELNRTTDFVLDVLVYFVGMLWMFYAFIDTSSLVMRYFAIVNFGGQTILKMAMHFGFYNAIREYHPKKSIKCLAGFVQGLFYVGIFGLTVVLVLVSRVPSNSAFSDIFKSLSGIITLLDGMIIFSVGILDKVCWTFTTSADREGE